MNAVTIPGIHVTAVTDALLETAEDRADALAIITPTQFHHEIAIRCLKKGKHIFIEKPIAQNVNEAEEIVRLSKEKKIIGQVGHVERFNPAFNSIKKIIGNPMFIESHRLSEFNPRGTDVSVVLDLMIHDIDIILSIIDSPIKSINANGTKVVSVSPDIVNARIEFKNKCVANLTASRISLKKMRKMRLFQRDSYISIDFDKGSSEQVKIVDYDKTNKYALTLKDSDGKLKEIKITNYKNQNLNAIVEEHNDFYNSIIKKTNPEVSFKEGLKALEVAILILNKINND